VKVFVSPHLSTILTAVLLLKSHPQLHDGGITLVLYPYAKEKVLGASTWPVSREQLNNFARALEQATPGISFDFSLMDAFEHPNCWFIDILSDEAQKNLLNSKVENYNVMAPTHAMLERHYKAHGEIENAEGFYDRIRLLKQKLRNELTHEMTEVMNISPNNKILLVTHDSIL